VRLGARASSLAASMITLRQVAKLDADEIKWVNKNTNTQHSLLIMIGITNQAKSYYSTRRKSEVK